MPGRKIWPNLFIVGAARSGTTSLYFYLNQHPDIFMSPIKEPHFFSRVRPDPRFNLFYECIEDEASYLALFSQAGDAKLRGEASPSYLWVPEAAQRITEVSPDASVVIILRDPVRRAHSHYLVDFAEGLEDRPFEVAIAEQLRRPDAAAWGQTPMYLAAGRYADAVERYLDLFRERVQVLIFEEFVANPRKSLADLFRFLDVDPSYAEIVDIEPHNVFHVSRGLLARRILVSFKLREYLRALIPTRFHRSFRRLLVKPADKPAINAATLDQLSDYYRSDTSRLARLLGRSLPW